LRVEISTVMSEHGHEQVVLVADPSSRLRAVIAIHSTALGPSLGGIRFWHYDHDADGIPDIYGIAMTNTGTGQTEVHILSGASNYYGWIEHAPTALGLTGPTWQFSAR